MAKFRTNHSQVSGPGRIRMLIWIIAIVSMILMIGYWMNTIESVH